MRALVVMVLLACGGLVSCSPGSPGSDETTGSHSGSPAATTTPPKNSVIPANLVGAWESSQPNSNTTLAYRFIPDGTYTYAGLLSYRIPDGGDYEMQQSAAGSVRLEGEKGDKLVLRPASSSLTKKDPRNPEGDVSNSPQPLTPKAYAWQVTDDVLTLIDETGQRHAFKRASP
ncbi:hypothetical protein AB0F13_16725 [Streptomyces sp. NPDC026206]|uniref:hypothetical protein n=1 Tax=Streptomyces sp. NPDC026206 TaxID=3157089 RepID=UPI00340622CE